MILDRLIVLQLSNYNPIYKCEHYDGKGRVTEFMKAQPSIPTDDDMSWTVVTSGPYMDMLFLPMLGPVKQREDGTAVFPTPVGNGHIAMIALSDLGFFARYSFDSRVETSGVELRVASDVVGWDYLAATFEKVTGQKAEVVHQSIDEWFENLNGVDRPIANEGSIEDGTITWRANFTAWWMFLRDDLITRDLDWIRKINPKGHTLESWMRAENYGERLWSRMDLLKNVEEGKNISPNWTRIEQY